MLILLAACSHPDSVDMLTLVGGGGATVVLTEIEVSGDASFDVPGLSQDDLDDLFRDGASANDALGRLNTRQLDEEDFQMVMIEHDGHNHLDYVQVWVNGLVGFEPCGLSPQHVYLQVSLNESSFSVWFDDRSSPTDNLFVASDVEEWTVSDDEGFASVVVEIACPSGPLTGLLELEWALDSDVARSAPYAAQDDTDFCLLCRDA